MTTLLQQRLDALSQYPTLLANCQRGIEKEGLRISPTGWLSDKPHPPSLGRALTHPNITTDYSEALLELITGIHPTVDGLLGELDWVHRLTACGLDDELIWNQSMPALLPPEPEIPIAWYGTSNTGMLKHVYRRGLALRYGKRMQCIAGLHYNFSLPEQLWSTPGLLADGTTDPSDGYVSQIRNFMRHSWLLMYLFGASPAVSGNFLVDHRDHGLASLDEQTYYLPWATSLRMSDLGYQNKAQSTLKLCYNDLPTFLSRLYGAVTTPWPAYEAMGTHQAGEWVQLNCNLLQIENEFYSTIRPKRSTARGERPITALAERGVQYIEVRCLDIDPFAPTGISAETARFMDAFLLFCALEHSPTFGDDGFCQESAHNFATVVKRGREPNLGLQQGGMPVALTDWAMRTLDKIERCAEALTEQTGDVHYASAVQVQRDKVSDATLTPSARVLEALGDGQRSFEDFGLDIAKQHTDHFRQIGLTAAEQQQAAQLRETSIQAQAVLEADHSVTFDQYVKQFNDALKAP